MVETKYLNVLKMICTRLANSGINWALTGSFGMALQGVQVKVHDIDLQTDEHGAYEIEKYFTEFTTRPVCFLKSKRIRSYYGVFEINGISVEVMGAVQKRLDDRTWEEPVNIEQYMHWIIVDKIQVPVLSLSYEYQAYRILGREDKANILLQWLQFDDEG